MASTANTENKTWILEDDSGDGLWIPIADSTLRLMDHEDRIMRYRMLAVLCALVKEASGPQKLLREYLYSELVLKSATSIMELGQSGVESKRLPKLDGFGSRMKALDMKCRWNKQSDELMDVLYDELYDLCATSEFKHLSWSQKQDFVEKRSESFLSTATLIWAVVLCSAGH